MALPWIIPLLMAGLGAGNEIKKGKQESKALKEEAVREETAVKEKKRVKRAEIDSLLSDQRSRFMKSGVVLKGTPLEVMSDTLRKGDEDLTNIDRGSRVDSLRKMARKTRNAGSVNALGTFLTTYMTAGGKPL